MKMRVVCLAISLFGFQTSFAAPPKQSPQEAHLRHIVEYQNFYKNFGEAVDDMAAMGVFSTEEKKAVEALLLQSGVNRDTSMPKGFFDANSMSWGKNKLIFQADGSFKVQRNGKILSSSKTAPRDQIFSDTLHALRENRSAHWSIFNEAYAAESIFYGGLTNADKVSMFVGDAGAAIGRTLYTTLSYLTFPVCAVAGVSLDATLWLTGKLIYEGTVSCHGISYVKNRYAEFWNQYKIDIDNAESEVRKAGMDGVSYSPKMEQATMAFCAKPIARALFSEPREPESRVKQDNIPNYLVNGAFGGLAPQCNPENARIVDAYLKDQMQKIAAAAKTAAREARFGASGPKVPPSSATATE